MKEFLKGAFSESGFPSSARLIMAYSTLCASFWISFIVWKTVALPDAVTMAGVVAFTTAAFAVGKFTRKDQDEHHE